MKASTTAQVALLFVACFLASLFFGIKLQAQVVSISATVEEVVPPVTTIVFSGIAYPGATVTITEDSLPFTSTVANANARFSVSESGLSAGPHTYGLQAEDADGRDSRILNVVVTIVVGTTTTVDDIFFGPTIVLSDTDIAIDESIVVSGTTSPSSSVAISLIHSGTAVYTVSADVNGDWSRTFTDAELDQGNYSVFAQATDPDASVSEVSSTLAFTVGEASDICYLKNVADINCDGEVDLIDLSILLAYWDQTNPGNPRTDINGDTIVNLIDFSIMMYHWTGPI